MRPDTTTALPPTQYLILEVLAARHRLGEQFWADTLTSLGERLREGQP